MRFMITAVFLYDIDLWVDIDTKTLTDISLDSLAKGDNLSPCSPTTIDKH